MLPGEPYDLRREDEPSRRVKDLVGAFAENPKLPKMLRQKEILDTIDNGVQSGVFVAVRKRPDQSVSGMWWRTPINEMARNDPALEVFLPGKIKLIELPPSVLVPGVLPSLWPGDHITVADVISYFQDLVEILPDLIRITAGMSLKFSLSVGLGDGREIGSTALDSINRLLRAVGADLCLAHR